MTGKSRAHDSVSALWVSIFSLLDVITLSMDRLLYVNYKGKYLPGVSTRMALHVSHVTHVYVRCQSYWLSNSMVRTL